MKILEANAGVLTNFEVLDFLRAKGASKDPTRVIAKVTQSEYKVYDYLVNTAASIQTRVNTDEFLRKIKLHDLAPAEILNMINTRPAAAVELFPIIEECESRFPDEMVEELAELVKKTLLGPPAKKKAEEITEGNEETATLKQEKDNENPEETTEGNEETATLKQEKDNENPEETTEGNEETATQKHEKGNDINEGAEQMDTS